MNYTVLNFFLSLCVHFNNAIYISIYCYHDIIYYRKGDTYRYKCSSWIRVCLHHKHCSPVLNTVKDGELKKVQHVGRYIGMRRGIIVMRRPCHTQAIYSIREVTTYLETTFIIKINLDW